jgi:2-iminobutanoate/2-iminopropanoate deaminase
MPRTAVTGQPSTGAYSPGVVAQGQLLAVSGQGPFRGARVVRGTIEQETELTLRNLLAIVEQAGGTEADVIRCGVFLADIADFDGMDRTYREVFSEPLPARTTVGCALDGIRGEIDCLAVIR